MSHSPSITVAHTLPIRGGRLALIALWSVQIVIAGMFLLAGGSKLAGAAAMVALFDAVGVGQWFRYVTGLIEVASAIALLLPALAPLGALLIASTMIGAVTTHLFIVGGSLALPGLLLLGALVVAWARRDQLFGAVSRRHGASA